MTHYLVITLILAGTIAISAAAKCTMLFDGRIPLDIVPADFDKNTSVCNNLYDHGENQTFAEIIKFPLEAPSIFDVPELTKPFEVTINDGSIFLPGGSPPQVGFRRSELIPEININGEDITVQGTTTFHWSIRNDPSRPLNFSHEYHPVWHETVDYSTSEFTFLTGTPFNHSFDPTVTNARTLRVAGRQSVSPETTFFQTPFVENVWHNFAVELGWTSNLITVYYSTDFFPLKQVAGPAPNVNTGGGSFHVGILKLPTGPLGIDVLHQGYQESGLNEGLIFGGVFIEGGEEGCVTLEP